MADDTALVGSVGTSTVRTGSSTGGGTVPTVYLFTKTTGTSTTVVLLR